MITISVPTALMIMYLLGRNLYKDYKNGYEYYWTIDEFMMGNSDEKY